MLGLLKLALTAKNKLINFLCYEIIEAPQKIKKPVASLS
jgi:hypothetical protein